MHVRVPCLALAALAVGCVGETAPPDTASVSAALLSPAAFDPAFACRDEVRVGVPLGLTDPALCPAPTPPATGTGWTVDKPTAGLLPGNRFLCRYTWDLTAGAPDASLLPDDAVGRPPADWLDRDCTAVVPLGDPAEPIHASRNAAYHAQMERAPRLPYLQAFGRWTVGPSPVQIAIIDSSVDSGPGEIEPTTGDFPHGRAVGLAIREMTCPEGRGSSTSACIPEFHSYLALDREHGERAPGGSGYHGLMSTLAERIDDAVNDWLAARTGAPLIINLSVGWHPEYHAVGNYRTSTGIHHSGAQAVRAALNRAACNGALVVAAVGNQTGGPAGGSRAMYPAAWASETTWGCSARPLVVAAGGVDAADRDLANARPHAATELVAPAFRVAVDNTQANSEPSPELLPMMTGSSFGAAGITAAAALVWGYRPSLSATEVMTQVYASARPLATAADPRVADVCWGAACQSTRRVSMCNAAYGAIAGACGGWIPCPSVPACTPVLPYHGTNPTDGLDPSGFRRVSPAWSVVTAPDCAAGRAWADPTGLPPSPNLCPSETSYGVLLAPHAVSSQPGPPGCSLCGLLISEDARELLLTINNDWDPEVPIKSPVLRVDEELFALESVLNEPLGPGDQVVIELPYFPKPETVAISFGLDADLTGEDGEYSLFEQIEIWSQ